jgi:hypothetical protein
MRARILMAAGVIAMLAAPGWAQQNPVQRYGEKDKDKTLSEQQAEKDAERAYQRSLGNVPAKAAVDPWGSARGAEAPKGHPKAGPKPKAKNVEAPN